jgi:hypothetical protein
MSNHIRRLTALAAVVAGLTVMASPASADLPGRETVTASSDMDSRDKGVTVQCPAGKRVVGSGAEIAGIPAGSGSVVLDDVVPTVDTVTAYAYEARGGTGNSWQIIAWAVCGNPHGSSTTNSLETGWTSRDKSVTVTCPAGKVVLGTGASITGGHGQVVIDEIKPTTTTVRVTALEVDFGYADVWKVRAYATCGDEPGGREIESRVTASTSDDKPGNAPCDPGNVVFGAGFDIEDGAGETFIVNLLPTNTVVRTFAMEDWDGSDGNGRSWALRSYAICGNA